MDIKKGDFVSLSEDVKKREWGPKVRHLKGEYPVLKVKDEYVTFKTDEGGFNGRTRRWHKSNLKLVSNWENV